MSKFTPCFIRVSIDKYLGDEMVAVSFVDWQGASWQLEYKVAYFTSAFIDYSTQLPVDGTLECRVVDSPVGDGALLIDVDEPWGLSSPGGQCTFVMHADAVQLAHRGFLVVAVEDSTTDGMVTACFVDCGGQTHRVQVPRESVFGAEPLDSMCGKHEVVCWVLDLHFPADWVPVDLDEAGLHRYYVKRNSIRIVSDLLKSPSSSCNASNPPPGG
jgi:hypothetical protein